MIYVEILGRIGNQMFSYAFARVLQEAYPRQKKEKIAFDFSNFEFGKEDKNALMHYDCSNNIVEEKRKCSIIQRILLKIYFRARRRMVIKNERDINEVEEKWKDLLSIFGIYINSFNYHKFKYKPITRNFLLLGYFESSSFFEEIDGEIRKEFRPINNETSKYASSIIDSIIEAGEGSVCVGIRRGDFESGSNVPFCSVCSVGYYERAIKLIKEKVEKPRFFFFTEEPEWVRKNICIPPNSLIIGDDKIKYWDKLYVMSKCTNFIVSNSTYVWWAQHLSTSRKIVIAPDRWRNITPEMHRAIYETDWITIEP